MRQFQEIQGFLDFSFFQGYFQFYGEVWSYPPKLEPLMNLIKEKRWAEAGKEFRNLLKLGDSFLKQIDGAFIIVYFERKEKRGFIFRSLLCKYSLYLRQTKRQIFWATRIEKVMHEDHPGPDKVNKEKLIRSCFAEALEPSQTYFTDIQKLPAGSMLRIANEKAEIVPYDLVYAQPDVARLKREQITYMIVETLTKTILKRVQSSDRIGVLLSGGIDSAVVLMLVKSCNIPVVAYHWGWLNEKSKYRASVEKLTGFANVPLAIIEPGELKDLSRDASSFNLPYPSLDYLMMEQTCKQSRKDEVNLLASGYFSEYIFGYYGTERFSRQIWSKSLFRRMMERMGMLRPTWADRPEDLPIPLFFTDEAAKQAKRFLRTLKEKADTREALGFSLNRDKETLIQLHQLTPHQMNMLFPFVSRELMELAVSLPPDMKVLFRGGQWIEKPLLRWAFFDWLPIDIITYVPRQYEVMSVESRFLMKYKDQVKELLNESSVLAQWGIIHCERLEQCLQHQRLLMLSTKGLIWAYMTEIWLRSLL
ncbi:MAG: asparagine synthase-related protein [Thermoactinomyces sp.]